VLGTGPRAAARQAAVLFLLAGLLALLGIANDPRRAADLTTIAAVDIAVGVTAWLFPWHRTRWYAPAALGLPGFAVLGFSTWAFGGVAAGTGPFLVLLYTWAGLHFPRPILLAFAVPATAAYLVPLVLTGQPPMVLGSAVVLMPVALAVAFLVEAQGRHLRDDRERLARIEQWRAALIGTLAHDVRTPLATVQMTLEELREGATGHAVGMVDGALRQTSRISRLATGLLDVNRIDSTGHLHLDRQLLPACRIIGEALSYVRPAGVSTDVDDDLMVCVDRERFEQIVINLVGNALRHGRPPVLVRMTSDGVTDRLEVRDQGAGVPEKLRPTLFSRFGSADRGGVGLGLWIVRQLAEAHGGEAHYEDGNPGACMVVTLPAA
jgi:signal transduction histidine kinase